MNRQELMESLMPEVYRIVERHLVAGQAKSIHDIIHGEYAGTVFCCDEDGYKAVIKVLDDGMYDVNINNSEDFDNIVDAEEMINALECCGFSQNSLFHSY